MVVKTQTFVFLISGGYNVTSAHDKAYLITYFCIQCGLLLQVVHNFCVNQPVCDS